MKIEYLILCLMVIFFFSIAFNRDLATQSLIAEILKIFISGYLGYIIKELED